MSNFNIEEHQKLVHQVCNRLKGKAGKIEYEELFQAGMEGLWYASKTYDPAKGAVSTYAVKTIVWYVNRYIANNSRTVRVPAHLQTGSTNATVKRVKFVKNDSHVDFTKPVIIPSSVTVTKCPPFTQADAEALAEAKLSKAAWMTAVESSIEQEEINLYGDPEDDPEKLLLKKEQRRTLATAIDQLCADEKTIIKLKMQEYTNQQISDMSGRSVSAISKLCRQAQNNIREFLLEGEEDPT